MTSTHANQVAANDSLTGLMKLKLIFWNCKFSLPEFIFVVVVKTTGSYGAALMVGNRLAISLNVKFSHLLGQSEEKIRWMIDSKSSLVEQHRPRLDKIHF